MVFQMATAWLNTSIACPFSTGRARSPSERRIWPVSESALHDDHGHRTAWLSETVLVAAGEFPLRAGTAPEVELGLMSDVDGEARFLHLEREGPRSKSRTSKGLVAVRLERRHEGPLEVVTPTRFTLSGWEEA